MKTRTNLANGSVEKAHQQGQTRLVEWLTLVAIVGGFAVAWFTLESIKDSVQLAVTSNRLIEQSMRLEARPWLRPHKFVLKQEPVDDGRTHVVMVSYYMNNIGKTPAINVVNRAHLAVWGPPEYPRPNWQELESKYPTVLYPGDTIPYKLEATVTVESEFVKDYLAGRKHLYLRHLSCYKDIFGGTHWEEFCQFHYFGQRLGYFSACDTGNAVSTSEVEGQQECQP